MPLARIIHGDPACNKSGRAGEPAGVWTSLRWNSRTGSCGKVTGSAQVCVHDGASEDTLPLENESAAETIGYVRLMPE